MDFTSLMGSFSGMNSSNNMFETKKKKSPEETQQINNDLMFDNNLSRNPYVYNSKKDYMTGLDMYSTEKYYKESLQGIEQKDQSLIQKF